MDDTLWASVENVLLARETRLSGELCPAGCVPRISRASPWDTRSFPGGRKSLSGRTDAQLFPPLRRMPSRPPGPRQVRKRTAVYTRQSSRVSQRRPRASVLSPLRSSDPWASGHLLPQQTVRRGHRLGSHQHLPEQVNQGRCRGPFMVMTSSSPLRSGPHSRPFWEKSPQGTGSPHDSVATSLPTQPFTTQLSRPQAGPPWPPSRKPQVHWWPPTRPPSARSTGHIQHTHTRGARGFLPDTSSYSRRRPHTPADEGNLVSLLFTAVPPGPGPQ